jgi:hypothetical protein
VPVQLLPPSAPHLSESKQIGILPLEQLDEVLQHGRLLIEGFGLHER